MWFQDRANTRQIRHTAPWCRSSMGFGQCRPDPAARRERTDNARPTQVGCTKGKRHCRQRCNTCRPRSVRMRSRYRCCTRTRSTSCRSFARRMTGPPSTGHWSSNFRRTGRCRDRRNTERRVCSRCRSTCLFHRRSSPPRDHRRRSFRRCRESLPRTVGTRPCRHKSRPDRTSRACWPGSWMNRLGQRQQE